MERVRGHVGTDWAPEAWRLYRLRLQSPVEAGRPEMAADTVLQEVEFRLCRRLRRLGMDPVDPGPALRVARLLWAMEELQSCRPRLELPGERARAELGVAGRRVKGR